MNENNNIKEILENMDVSEAVDYFKNERNISQRIQILKNMSVEQIASLIKNENNVIRLLTQLDNDKLLNVINNLDEAEIKIIFEKPLNEYSDTLATTRNTLLERLKNRGLTESAINIFKELGYNDFDNEITHSDVNSTPIVDIALNETPILSPTIDTNSSLLTDLKSMKESNDNIISIKQAISEKDKIKKSFNDYLKSVDDISDLYLNRLYEISNSKILDNFLGDINELKNKNIDKNDLDKYVDFFASLKDINRKVINNKQEIELRIKSLDNEFNSINRKIEKIDGEIFKLKNEISKNKDPNNKGVKEQELLKLEREKDDLIDLINYLFQGNKYLTGYVFKNKNKPIPDIIKNRKSKNTSQPVPPAPAPQPAPPTPAPQTAPPAPAPQPVSSAPQTIPNSIKYYIEKGVLPNNLTESEYLALASDLSIPAADMDYVLTEDELKRLLTSKKIMMAIINQNAKNIHGKSIDEYEKLIAQYENILSNMNGYKHSDKEEKFIENVINDLKDKRDKYNEKIDNLGYEDANDYISFEKDKKNNEINVISKQMDRNEKLLSQKYSELEKEQSNLKNPKFKNMQGAINKKIAKINQEIEKLQKKQIELNKTQTMIINKNTDKYIAKVKEKQQRYRDEQRLASAHEEKMFGIEYEKTQLEEEREKLNNDLSSMNPTNKKEEKQKNKTERDLNKINRRIAALNLKQGYCSLENQVCQGVALSGYTK